MSREKEIAKLRTTLSLDTGNFKKELTSVSKQTTGLKRSFDIANKSIGNAEDKFKATTSAIAKGEKAIDKMNKKLSMQIEAYKDLKITVDKQSKSYQDLIQELNDAKKELEELEKAENKNVEAIEKQKKAIDNLKSKLQDKAQLIDKNINQLQKYSNDIDKTENDITGLGNQLGKLKNSLKETSNATDNSGLDKLKDLASEAGIDLGILELGAKATALALATLITKKIIESAGTYDKAITDLQITMGLTEESAKDLYDSINDITDKGYSIEGVSEAVKMLQQRFNLSEAETKKLAQGMDLLNKYGYENKDIIRFMTSATNDWEMSYEDALDYILTGHQKGLNISEDWMDTLVEYTPILSTLGVGGKEAFALISEAVKATGLDTDKAADMVKEFYLTLTDGSNTSKDAFSDLGINIDKMKKQIDDSSITSVDAMKKVMQAIMKVGDETEQARLLQEIFKGTIEYGSIGVVEAWGNMEDSIVNTKGAIDNAKIAYEGSYEAMTQDLSQSWDELTQTIGSAVLPSLLEIVQALLAIPFNMELAGTQMTLSWEWVMSQLDNAWLGFVGGVQEGIINILEASESATSTLGMDGVAEKLSSNVDSMKSKHDELVEKIKTNEETITSNSDKLGQLWNNEWSGTLEENKATFNSIMEEMSTKAKSTNGNVSITLENTSKKISNSTSKAKQDASSNFKDIKNSAKSELSGVKGAVDDNMDGSLKTVQVQATEMYKGVKTSFHKMKQSAKKDGTEMYLGVKTSASKMADSAKRSATDMYKGVTTSTSRMAQKAIADWNSIRNAFSKNISGTITTHKKTVISKPENQSIEPALYSIAPIDLEIMPIDTNSYDLNGAYYRSSTPQSKILAQHFKTIQDNTSLTSIIKELKSLTNKFESNLKGDKTIYFELPFYADGRELARISAVYMDDELKIINNRKSRNRGDF